MTKKWFVKGISSILVMAMVLGGVFFYVPAKEVEAAKKPKLNKTKITITVGSVYQLKVRNKIKKSTYSWKTLNKKVVKVTKKGKITAIKKGTSSVLCTIKNKKKTYRLKCKVKVVEKAIPTPVPTIIPLSSLKTIYANNFHMGVAINQRQLVQSNIMGLVKNEFDSITMENEMKPDSLIDQDRSKRATDGNPVIRTEGLNSILTLARDNGLKLRGHTLVWHSQTPDWFFREGYNPKGNYLSKEAMLLRMESYIKQVLEFCQTNYPGVIYAWDVVNEAVDGRPMGYRNTNSKWFTIIGSEFVEKAFEYARKYAAPEVKLFYNDYDCYSLAKRDFIYQMVSDIKAKGLVDGIGMQSHIDLNYPSVAQFRSTIEKFSSIPGIEIQLTELDMHNPFNTTEDLQLQANRYKELFGMLLELDRSGAANITSVTFWGLTDADTWLTRFKRVKSYPLLFNSSFNPKVCYQGIVEAATVN